MEFLLYGTTSATVQHLVCPHRKDTYLVTLLHADHLTVLAAVNERLQMFCNGPMLVCSSNSNFVASAVDFAPRLHPFLGHATIVSVLCPSE
jgi:hypothetical protein